MYLQPDVIHRLVAQGPQCPLEGWALQSVPEWRLLHKMKSAHSKQAASLLHLQQQEWNSQELTGLHDKQRNMQSLCSSIRCGMAMRLLSNSWLNKLSFLLHVSDTLQLLCIIIFFLVILGCIHTYPLFYYLSAWSCWCHATCCVLCMLSQVWANSDCRHNYTVSLALS